MECVHCRGNLTPGRVTYTAYRHRYHLLLDDAAGWTCQHCGEPVFEERVIEGIQQLLMTLDEGMELVSHWGTPPPQPGDGVNSGDACMDTPHDVIGREREKEAMTPQQAAKGLQDWATKHSKALTSISAVEAIREARESR
jgi:YgiT-type zinc finger domain-containing protein